MAEKVEIKLVVDGKTGQLKVAQERLGKLGKAAKRSGASAKTAGLSFGALATSIGGVLALTQIISFFRDATNAAVAQSDAVLRLNASLAETGEFTEEASIQVQKWAQALQGSTRVGDEVILQQVALAKSFVGSKEAAQELVEASLDFAIAADLNLTEATRRLGRATQGTRDDIAKFAPEINKLTRAQLEAGDATRIIAERFRGAAAAQAAGLGGSLDQLTNKFSDLQELIVGQLQPTFDAWIGAVEFGIGVFERFLKIQDDTLSVNRLALRQSQERLRALTKELDFVAFLGGARDRDIAGINKKMEAERRLLVEIVNRIKAEEEGAKQSEDIGKRKTEVAEESEAELKKRAELERQLALEFTELEQGKFEQQLLILEQQIEALRAAKITEFEIEEDFVTRKVTLEEFRAARTKVIFDEEEKRQADMRKRTADDIKKQAELHKKAGEQRKRDQRDVFGFISSLASSENAKLANIGKAAAITTALQDTFAAANKALAAFPPPANFAAAAAVTAAGIANVGRIRQLQKGGRSNGPEIIQFGEKPGEIETVVPDGQARGFAMGVLAGKSGKGGGLGTSVRSSTEGDTINFFVTIQAVDMTDPTRLTEIARGLADLILDAKEEGRVLSRRIQDQNELDSDTAA